VPIYSLTDPGRLRSPALVVALEGWVNAGEAGTGAAEVLAGDARVVATFDSDALFDYRVLRPTLDFVQGVMEKIVWPQMIVRHRPLLERDLLILTGAEPNWNWRRLGTDVVDLVLRLGVVEHVSIGGIPWAAPHTRPVSVIATASDQSRLDPSDERPEGLLRVPAAAVSTIEFAVKQAGVPTSGFWARVPQYIGAHYHPAVIALLERTSRHLGISIDLDSLREEADAQKHQLDLLAEERPEVKAMIEQLETLVDQQGEVSGEQLAAEIERFLREQGDDRRG